MPISEVATSETDRLSRLESLNEAVAGRIADLATIVEQMRTDQGVMSDKLSLIGRWDAKTILSMFGLVLTPVVAMWGLAIAPIQQELVLHRTYQERLDERANVNQHGITVLNEKFVEVETQFRQVIEHQNFQNEHLEGRVAEVWKAEFGRDMARTEQYPGAGHERR